MLLIASMLPVTVVFRKTRNGIQLGRQGTVIHHLLFMDDAKIYEKYAKSLNSIAQTLQIITDVIIVKKKTIQTKEIQFSDKRIIKNTGES